MHACVHFVPELAAAGLSCILVGDAPNDEDAFFFTPRERASGKTKQNEASWSVFLRPFVCRSPAYPPSWFLSAHRC